LIFEIIVKVNTDSRNFDLLVKDAAPGPNMTPEEFQSLIVWCLEQVTKNMNAGNCSPMKFEEENNQGIIN
jgi:hypothetical protein